MARKLTWPKGTFTSRPTRKRALALSRCCSPGGGRQASWAPSRRGRSTATGAMTVCGRCFLRARSSPVSHDVNQPSGPRRARQVGGNREAATGMKALEWWDGALFPVVTVGEESLPPPEEDFHRGNFASCRSPLTCHFLSVDPACPCTCGQFVADDLWKTKCTEAE
jgi:hypothetical protein